jgi:hypothetical protein
MDSNHFYLTNEKVDEMKTKEEIQIQDMMITGCQYNNLEGFFKTIKDLYGPMRKIFDYENGPKDVDPDKIEFNKENGESFINSLSERVVECQAYVEDLQLDIKEISEYFKII